MSECTDSQRVALEFIALAEFVFTDSEDSQSKHPRVSGDIGCCADVVAASVAVGSSVCVQIAPVAIHCRSVWIRFGLGSVFLSLN
mmetsp:Transcript_130318/g.325026  ORF Transcript_130318/g.325026 Transcript_130318/m.325026 type:complete len:85 (+) Transcript_130318:1210-1464(+)